MTTRHVSSCSFFLDDHLVVYMYLLMINDEWFELWWCCIDCPTTPSLPYSFTHPLFPLLTHTPSLTHTLSLCSSFIHSPTLLHPLTPSLLSYLSNTHTHTHSFTFTSSLFPSLSLPPFHFLTSYLLSDVAPSLDLFSILQDARLYGLSDNLQSCVSYSIWKKEGSLE